MSVPNLETEKINKKLKYWEDQLQDMGRRNQLLFFKETRTSSLYITSPELPEVFRRVVVDGNSIYATLPPKEEDLNPTDEVEQVQFLSETEVVRKDEFGSNKTVSQVNNVLRNLRYKARTISEEQGFNALYLTFGMLSWQEGIEGELVDSPIILVPVEINREEKGNRFRISMVEEEILLNPTLQTKLETGFELRLPDISNLASAEDLNSFFKEISVLIEKYRDWKLSPKVALGIFTFQTQMIISDIQNNTGYFSSNPIIKLLSGILENLIGSEDELPEVDKLDDETDPFQVFQILDADSSQQAAIEAAKKGISFVLQGPPGTGKSQTIANIIAESLGAGKKVLFVSQKSVALDVVSKRLIHSGLGDFCLEVHSYKKNKKDVIDELGRSLSDVGRINLKDSSAKKRDLDSLKKALNNYVRALHKPRFALNLSLQTIYGELSRLLESPQLRFSLGDIRELSHEDISTHVSSIRELQEFGEILDSIQGKHPWLGFARPSISIEDREDISDRFVSASKELDIYLGNVLKIAENLKVKKPQSLAECMSFFSVIKVFQPTMFALEHKELVGRFLREYNNLSFLFSPRYWRDRKMINSLQWEKKKYGNRDIRHALLILDDLRNQSYDMGNPNIENIGISYSDIEAWLNSETVVKNTLKFASELFESEFLPKVLDPDNPESISQLGGWLKNRAEQTHKIQEWILLRDTTKRANSIGLSGFISQAVELKIPSQQWEDAYMRRVYLLLVDAINQEDPIVTKTSGHAHQGMLEKFREIDEELIRITATELRAKLLSSKPAATWVQAESAEAITLKKEMNKKRRIKPLRKLFAEIPNLILGLRPCLMMSPYTVSLLLDPELYQFDIAIFDEASQIPPEFAISTIVRAKQIVVAGDRHQLPPTRFFQSLEFDDDELNEDYEVEDYESILHACDSISMKNVMLRWHYRSEDESLIAFSNLNFYDNKLCTFPNSNMADKKTKGIEYIYVPDGIYRRGKGARNNPVEARRVGQLVIELLRSHPELSIGIVAFSQSQRDMIELELERIRLENPDISPLFDYKNDEHLFCKNLETVQGDERDVIIFSIGYGKDEIGKMSMNFGPLNRTGGQRRLNVAVTRARKAVKVVTSIDPEDIDLTKSKSDGTRLLKSYLKVARYGSKALIDEESVNTEAEFGSPFEESVYDALTQRGLELNKQVGVSEYRIDFGVVDPNHPGGYLLGIECDGRAYHSTPTARDRDRLRQQILEDKFGWWIHRIWSRDWIENRDNEIQKVFSAVEKSRVEGSRRTVKKK